MVQSDDVSSPNGLGISGGAPVDRENGRADSNLQKSDDLAGAKRRPLHALVGRLGLLQSFVSSAQGSTTSEVTLKQSSLPQRPRTQAQLESVAARRS